MAVKRIYVEKKADYAVRAKELLQELKEYLSLDGLKSVRVLVRYDVENVSENIFKKALVTVFSEPPVDILYESDFPKEAGDHVFSVEYLPAFQPGLDQFAHTASSHPDPGMIIAYIIGGSGGCVKHQKKRFAKPSAMCIIT